MQFCGTRLGNCFSPIIKGTSDNSKFKLSVLFHWWSGEVELVRVNHCYSVVFIWVIKNNGIRNASAFSDKE